MRLLQLPHPILVYATNALIMTFLFCSKAHTFCYCSNYTRLVSSLAQSLPVTAWTALRLPHRLQADFVALH